MKKSILFVLLSLVSIFSIFSQENITLKTNADTLFVLEKIIKSDFNTKDLQKLQFNMYMVESDNNQTFPKYKMNDTEKLLVEMLITAFESLMFSNKTRDALLNEGTIAKLIKKIFDFISLGSQGYSSYALANNLNKKLDDKENNINQILIPELIALATQGTNLFWINELVQEAKYINDAGEKVKLLIPMQEGILKELKDLKTLEFENEIEFRDKLLNLQKIINDIFALELEIYNMLPEHLINKKKSQYPDIEQIEKRIANDPDIYYKILLGVN